MLRLKGRAMGTAVTVGVPDVSGAARIFGLFGEWERIFSRFLPQSELSRVNGSRGSAVLVGDTFLRVLLEAVRFSQETDGLFSPFLGKRMRAIGYTVPFGSPGFPGGADEPDTPADAVRRPEQTALSVDLDARTVRLPPRLELDLGGYAKGAAADRAAQLAKRASPCGLVDAGGDLTLWQDADHPFPWAIGVEDPLRPGNDRLVFHPKADLCAATSSICRRRWMQGGVPRHHLIDPRTGVSACTDCLQATVFAGTVRRAEVYAKCVVLRGAAGGAAWMDAHHPECAYLLIREDGAVVSSPNLARFCS